MGYSRPSEQRILVDWQGTGEKQRLIIVTYFNKNIQRKSYN